MFISFIVPTPPQINSCVDFTSAMNRQSSVMIDFCGTKLQVFCEYASMENGNKDWLVSYVVCTGKEFNFIQMSNNFTCCTYMELSCLILFSVSSLFFISSDFNFYAFNINGNVFNSTVCCSFKQITNQHFKGYA